MADSMGQQIIMDNRPGAGGSIATEIGARAVPDGCNLLMTTNGHTIQPRLSKVNGDQG